MIEIEVHVAKWLVQLFNNIDAAPFASRDLDPRAERFIVDSAKDLPRDASFGLCRACRAHARRHDVRGRGGPRALPPAVRVGEAAAARVCSAAAGSASRSASFSSPLPSPRASWPRAGSTPAACSMWRPLNCSSTTGGRSAPKRGLSTVWHPSGARGQVLIIIDGNSRWYISSRRIRSVAANPPHRVPCASLLFTYNPISSAVG